MLIWVQDEARFGQQNTTTRLWAPTGTRPRAVQQQQFDYVYCFGAVCVNTGQTESIVSPVANKKAMDIHLELISKATPCGKHSVVLMDNAGWHQESLAEKYDNITIIRLPPYSPELNPVEQVWSQMRQHSLANRVFEDLDELLSAVCDGWNTFREDAKAVISLCFRQWFKLSY